LYIQEALLLAFLILTLLLSFLINKLEVLKMTHLRPSGSKRATSFKLAVSKSHVIFTAETLNFPTGVAP
jgi:hypothetical protein